MRGAKDNTFPRLNQYLLYLPLGFTVILGGLILEIGLPTKLLTPLDKQEKNCDLSIVKSGN